MWQYVQLGVLHIWAGFDHLLFVFGLLLLVNKRSRLVWTITAFTLAHSITLAMATLRLVTVPVAFTEAAIALSIVFLAVELMHHHAGEDGLAYKYPWIVSFVFGLLHGLGFASALQDVGLPQNNISLALLLFNIGVEVGQLVFVFIILLLVYLIRPYTSGAPMWSTKVPVYLIGSIAMYWFIERTVYALCI